MAQFRARIQGQRGEASRLGSKKSGITSETNGWNAGVAIEGKYSEADQSDILHITVTGGSGYNSFPDTYLGYVKDGGVFIPSQKLKESIWQQGDNHLPAWIQRAPNSEPVAA